MAVCRVVGWAVVVLVVLMIASCAGINLPGMTMFYACFGWLFFLRRVVPQIIVNWSGVATAVACLAGVVCGGHWFLRWLCANLPAEVAENRPWGRWKPLWSACLAAGIVLMFASGLCVVGIAHQATWLMTSPDRLVESSWKELLGRASSNNNLQQIGSGLLRYHEVTGTFPAGVTFDKMGRPQHGWQTMLLPFVDQTPLYNRIDRSLAWNDPKNREPFDQEVSVYQSVRDGSRSQDRGYAKSGYAGNPYLLAGPKEWTAAEMTDGQDTTIWCGEAATQPRPWGDPVNWRDPQAGIGQRANRFGGPFEEITQFVFVDGHTRAISNQIDPAVLSALCTPASGESLPEFQDGIRPGR